MLKNKWIIGVVAMVFIVGGYMVTQERHAVRYDVTAQAQQGLDVQSWQTARGLKVIYVGAHELPMVDVRILFDAGTVRDNQQQAGLATLTNALLNQGTTNFTADEIANKLSSLGTQLVQDVGSDYATVGFRALSDKKSFNPSLSLLQELLQHPAFAADAFSRIQQQQLLSISYQKQRPGMMANKASRALLFGQQGYGLPSYGYTKSVEQLQPTDVAEFYKKHYGLHGSVLAIVGDVSLGKAQFISDEISQVLTDNQLPKLITAKTLTQGQEQKISFNSTQKTLVFSGKGIKRDDADYFPLIIGNYILGGGNGLISRLAVELREKRGLVYSIYSYYQALRGVGPFMLQLQTKQESADEAAELVITELEKFVEQGITEEELAQAKQYLTGSFPLNVASNANIVINIARMAFYNLPVDYLDQYRDNINAVTVADVNRAFKNHLEPKQLNKVSVG